MELVTVLTRPFMRQILFRGLFWLVRWILFLTGGKAVLIFGVFLQEACNAAVEKYGVGACGPRGFYGTMGK